MRPAKTQLSLGIRPVWSESTLSAWRRLESLATHSAHSEDSDQTGRMPKLSWVFAGRTVTLLVLSCRGPYRSLWLFPLDPCYTTIVRIPLVRLDPAVVAIIHLDDFVGFVMSRLICISGKTPTMGEYYLLRLGSSCLFSNMANSNRAVALSGTALVILSNVNTWISFFRVMQQTW